MPLIAKLLQNLLGGPSVLATVHQQQSPLYAVATKDIALSSLSITDVVVWCVILIDINSTITATSSMLVILTKTSDTSLVVVSTSDEKVP